MGNHCCRFTLLQEKGEQRTFKHWVNNIFSAIICLVFGGILGQVFVYIPTIGSSKKSILFLLY